MMMKKARLILIVLLVLQMCFFTLANAPQKAVSQTDCNWGNWGKTLGHERVTDQSCGPGTDNITRIWEYQVADTLCSSASIWDDKVYMGSEFREFCLGKKSGEFVWRDL